MSASDGPLAGLRVIDLSTVFAAPYLGGLMRDLGADVIKVEPPSRLDPTRGDGYGPYLHNQPGADGWNWSGTFHSLNRGKRSLVLDLKQARGRDVLRALVRTADVLLENFTPRVMRGWHLAYADLAQVNPRLVMLSNTGYGASGPWSPFKAQGTTLEATMGLTNFTGYPADQPKKVVQSYPDFLACWTGLYAIHAAMLERDTSGLGQWIDLGMYQLGATVMPEALIEVQAGLPPLERTGNQEPDTILSAVVPAAGADAWLAVAAEDAEALGALSRFLGLNDESPSAQEAEAALRQWAARRDPGPASAALQAAGVAAAQVVGVRELLADPQFTERRFFEWIDIKGTLRPVIGRPYTWDASSRVAVRGAGPRFGENNDEVLRDLGLDAGEASQLRDHQVVVDEPLGIAPPPKANLEAFVQTGVYKEIDPDAEDVIAALRAATD
jgi:crotonobetainyl-CoA:carnitine CoA-transferase CaiB-like acyl-CoA transferase